MKITKLVPIYQNEEFDYAAEVMLTRKQLEFISNIGLGVLLQAGAMSFMFDEKDIVSFETDGTEKGEKNEKTVEGTSETIVPSPAGTQE